MSKIRNNPILKGVSGMLGDVIVYRESRGRMVMSNRPKASGRPRTEKQEVVKDKFLEAQAYAKGQMEDAVSKAEYQARVNNKTNSAFAVALTDYLKAPKILSVNTENYTGAIGNSIVVRAMDNFKVVSVRVEIRDTAGLLLEQGEAVNDAANNIFWRYTAQTSIGGVLNGTKIRVLVSDKPGNVTTKEVVL